jgi:hypothetical protein
VSAWSARSPWTKNQANRGIGHRVKIIIKKWNLVTLQTNSWGIELGLIVQSNFALIHDLLFLNCYSWNRDQLKADVTPINLLLVKKLPESTIRWNSVSTLDEVSRSHGFKPWPRHLLVILLVWISPSIFGFRRSPSDSGNLSHIPTGLCNWKN